MKNGAEAPLSGTAKSAQSTILTIGCVVSVR